MCFSSRFAYTSGTDVQLLALTCVSTRSFKFTHACSRAFRGICQIESDERNHVCKACTSDCPASRSRQPHLEMTKEDELSAMHPPRQLYIRL